MLTHWLRYSNEESREKFNRAKWLWATLCEFRKLCEMPVDIIPYKQSLLYALFLPLFCRDFFFCCLLIHLLTLVVFQVSFIMDFIWTHKDKNSFISALVQSLNLQTVFWFWIQKTNNIFRQTVLKMVNSSWFSAEIVAIRIYILFFVRENSKFSEWKWYHDMFWVLVLVHIVLWFFAVADPIQYYTISHIPCSMFVNQKFNTWCMCLCICICKT